MRYLRRREATGEFLAPAIEVRRVKRRSKGSSIIEFAFVAPIFFLLCAGIIDFGRLFFVQMTVQSALREAARYATIGQHQSGNDPSTGQPYTREASIRQIIITEAAAAGVKASDMTITLMSVNGGNNIAGTPMDTMSISVQTTLRLITPYIGHFFTPNGSYVVTQKISFKTEAFKPGCIAPPYTGC